MGSPKFTVRRRTLHYKRARVAGACLSIENEHTIRRADSLSLALSEFSRSGSNFEVLLIQSHSQSLCHLQQDGFSRQEAQRAAQIPGQGKKGLHKLAKQVVPLGVLDTENTFKLHPAFVK